MRQRVIVAECYERANLEQSSSIRSDLISDHRGILPLNHAKGLLDIDAARLIGEHGIWVEPESGLESVALGVNYVRILIRRKLDSLAVDDQRLFELAQKECAARWRICGGEEEAVVAARV